MKHSITPKEYEVIDELWRTVQKSIEGKTRFMLSPEVINNTKAFIKSCELAQLSSECVFLWGHSDNREDQSSARVMLAPSSSQPSFAFDDFIMASHSETPPTDETPCWLVIRRVSGCNWRLPIWHNWYLIYIYAKPQADKDGVLYSIHPEGMWFSGYPLINLSDVGLQEMR